MGIPAVPSYIPQGTIESTPPGHRFRMFFSNWNPANWDSISDNKKEAVDHAAKLNQTDKRNIKNLIDRQAILAGLCQDQALKLDVKSVAPFVTGMGIEHPLENGFAFFDPWGIPYLPGSGVKGVVRRAAENLALFENNHHGWSLLDIWWLFGFDENSGFFPKSGKDPEWIQAASQNLRMAPEEKWEEFLKVALPEREMAATRRRAAETGDRQTAMEEVKGKVQLRGSLCFWDVFPLPAGNSLRTDIMNPHYGDYYQKGNPPGDWSDPNPIFFLAIPEKSEFQFVVTLNPVGDFPEQLKEKWRDLASAAFRYAFQWLGFGGKTSLGYGQMADTMGAAAPENGPIGGGQGGPVVPPELQAEIDRWKKGDIKEDRLKQIVETRLEEIKRGNPALGLEAATALKTGFKIKGWWNSQERAKYRYVQQIKRVLGEQ